MGGEHNYIFKKTLQTKITEMNLSTDLAHGELASSQALSGLKSCLGTWHPTCLQPFGSLRAAAVL